MLVVELTCLLHVLNMKELVNNFTVEEYVEARNGHKVAPTTVLDNNNPGWSDRIVNAWREKRGIKRSTFI